MDEMTYDKRILERRVKRGDLKAQDVDNHIKSLVDAAENSEDISELIFPENDSSSQT